MSLLIFLVLFGYAQIPRDERICEECNKCEMEDELHFLFKCDKYDEWRLSLYHKLPELLNFNDNLKIFQLLNEHIYIFSNYLKAIWELRNNAIL